MAFIFLLEELLFSKVGFKALVVEVVKPTLLNKSCSNQKILADLLLKLLKLESKKWSQNFDWRPCYLVIAILSAKYPYR